MILCSLADRRLMPSILIAFDYRAAGQLKRGPRDFSLAFFSFQLAIKVTVEDEWLRVGRAFGRVL